MKFETSNQRLNRHTDYFIVAEDDADDRFLIQKAFEDGGFSDKIRFVENGVELVTFLNALQNPEQETFPGFILLDLNMPKKDGREVLKEIKQHVLFRTIPVVVFSTTNSRTEIKRCYELGANTYVVKPVDFNSFLNVLVSIRNYWFETAYLPA